MSQRDPGTQTVVDAIAAALLGALGDDSIDLLPDDQGTTIAADDWSLRIEESPVMVAWLAIDNEPDVEMEYGPAIREALSAPGEVALAEADTELRGELCRLLNASGDRFSAALARRLETVGKDRGR